MFLQSRFRSLVPWDEGACRTLVSVPGKCAAAAQPWLARGTLRVLRSFEMCLWSFCSDIPSKDVLVGTAPLDCVEIPCVEGKSH